MLLLNSNNFLGYTKAAQLDYIGLYLDDNDWKKLIQRTLCFNNGGTYGKKLLTVVFSIMIGLGLILSANTTLFASSVEEMSETKF